jgi:hypothetical protein
MRKMQLVRLSQALAVAATIAAALLNAAGSGWGP